MQCFYIHWLTPQTSPPGAPSTRHDRTKPIFTTLVSAYRCNDARKIWSLVIILASKTVQTTNNITHIDIVL